MRYFTGMGLPFDRAQRHLKERCELSRSERSILLNAGSHRGAHSVQRVGWARSITLSTSVFHSFSQAIILLETASMRGLNPQSPTQNVTQRHSKLLK